MKVGFIGLGIMGRPMAKNLIKAGHELVVCDFNKSAVDDLVSCGAKAAANGAEIAKECNVIITMVPNSPHVRAACLGEGGIIETGNENTVVLDMSSIDPTESKAIAAVAEALTFAKKAGTDPELVYQAIRGGLAGSTVMDAKAPMMLAGNYKPGFRIELHIKDMNNVLNAAHAINMPVPMAAQMMEIMQNLKTFGGEKEDHSSMVKYYERISGVSIVKED